MCACNITRNMDAHSQEAAKAYRRRQKIAKRNKKRQFNRNNLCNCTFSSSDSSKNSSVSNEKGDTNINITYKGGDTFNSASPSTSQQLNVERKVQSITRCEHAIEGTVNPLRKTDQSKEYMRKIYNDPLYIRYQEHLLLKSRLKQASSKPF